jgi:hypothetical protein
MLIGIAADPEPPTASLTWTLSVKTPDTVGIPATIPPAGDKVNPRGTELADADQV